MIETTGHPPNPLHGTALKACWGLGVGLTLWPPFSP